MTVREPCGHYLAGLTDGEGCFAIWKTVRPRKRDGWRCAFLIHLRRDDLPLLEALQAETGLGRINLGRRSKVGGDHPSVRWVVARKAECLQLVSIFEAYPLRSKKARDFEVWAEAVRAWSRGHTYLLPALSRTLKETRAYAADAVEWPDEVAQLELVESE